MNSFPSDNWDRSPALSIFLAVRGRECARPWEKGFGQIVLPPEHLI